MIRNEALIDKSIREVERVLEAARNSNQAGEDAIVAMAAWSEMKAALRDTINMARAAQMSLGMQPDTNPRIIKAKVALAKAEGKETVST